MSQPYVSRGFSSPDTETAPASATLPLGGLRSRTASLMQSRSHHSYSAGMHHNPFQNALHHHHPATQPKRWLIYVKPCGSLLDLIESQQQQPARSAFRQGILSPLQPTLAGQLVSLSKDFSFPTSSGLGLLLDSPFGAPNLNEEIWTVLWQDPSPLQGTNLPIAGSLLLDVDPSVGWFSVWLQAESNAASKDRRSARRRLTLMGSFSSNSFMEEFEQAQAEGKEESTATSLASEPTACEEECKAKPSPVPEQAEQDDEADLTDTESPQFSRPAVDFRLHYPSSLGAIYPSLYPYLELYPRILEGFRATAPRVDSKLTTELGYPSSLYQLYPALYPFFDIYPHVPTRYTTQQSTTPHDIGYPCPLYNIYPPTHSLGSTLQLKKSVMLALTPTVIDDLSPLSPERLPSVGLASRLQTPEGEESFFADQQLQFMGHSKLSAPPSPGPALIEQDLTVRMVPLAIASLPSPTEQLPVRKPSRANLVEHFRQDPKRGTYGYPGSLHCIYPAQYPYFELYPALQSAAGAYQSPVTLLKQDPTRGTYGYPGSLHCIYPAQYPYFELYPSLQTAAGTNQSSVTPLKQDPTRGTYGYPGSLHSIYPSLYPHLDLYPALQEVLQQQQIEESRPLVDEDGWLISPMSPDRLPSVGLASRLGTPEGEESFFAHHQDHYLSYNSVSGEATPPPALIEQDATAGVIPLAVASLLSPEAQATPMKLALQNTLAVQWDLDPTTGTYGYPASIHCIYPAVYPHFELYPALEEVQKPEEPASSSMYDAEGWLIHPLSPDRLPSVGLMSRLQTPSGEEGFFAKQQEASSKPKKMIAPPSPLHLVEPAFDVPMVSLADASELSPMPLSAELLPPRLEIICPSGAPSPPGYPGDNTKTPTLHEIQDFIHGASQLDFSDSDSEGSMAGTGGDGGRPILFPFGSNSEVMGAIAQFVIETEHQCLANSGFFKLALPPQLVPSLVSGLLSTGLSHEAHFERWHIWWTDQSIDPDADLGDIEAVEMLAQLSIGPEQVHNASLPPHFKLSEAHEWAQLVAHDYERTLMDTFEQLDARDNVDGKPSFDLVLLSSNEDGHVGPYTPDHPALAEEDWLCTAIASEQPQALPRVTMTLPLIHASLRTGIVVQGAQKAAVHIADALENPFSDDLPLSRFCITSDSVAVFALEAACEVTTYPKTAFWALE